MIDLLEKHFAVQKGMYFSKKLTFSAFSIFLSEMIDDAYWNYAYCNENSCFTDALQSIEESFKIHDRHSCLYIADDRSNLQGDLRVLESKGYSKISTESFMVYNGASFKDNTTQAELVVTKKQEEDFLNVFVKAYGGEKSDDQPYGTLPDSYIKSLNKSFFLHDKFFHFVCYDGRIPISIASLCFFEGSAGIYNVGTDPLFRGKGFGSSATISCVSMWKKLNGRQLFLQTETGSSVEAWYIRMGFDVVFHGSLFLKD
jgi:ribosomal protein S18 acetylase RimI-like enzyme